MNAGYLKAGHMADRYRQLSECSGCGACGWRRVKDGGRHRLCDLFGMFVDMVMILDKNFGVAKFQVVVLESFVVLEMFVTRDPHDGSQGA